MMEPGVRHSTAGNVQEVLDLLAELDRTSATEEGRWANKRRDQRRRVRVPCRVRYLAPNGQTVCTAAGHTRDVSLRGLGFVMEAHFARGAPLEVTITLGECKTRRVSGRVVYSRFLRDGWHLTGIRFEPIGLGQLESDGARASADAPSTQGMVPQALQYAAPAGTPQAGPRSGDDRSDQTVNQKARLKGSNRDKSLRALALAASLKRNSREALTKVLLLSASDDHVVRRAAIPALLQIAGPEAKEGLVRLLEDVNPQIQIEAAEALGQLNAKTAIEPIRRLLRHEKVDVTLRAAAVLGRLDDRSGLTVVRHYLAKDNPHTRDAVRTLGIIMGRRFRLNEQGIAEARREIARL
jgi:hypothetical protein